MKGSGSLKRVTIYLKFEAVDEVVFRTNQEGEFKSGLRLYGVVVIETVALILYFDFFY